MTIETHDPQGIKKVVAKAFGVSAKGERLTIEGRNENIYIDFVVGDYKDPMQVLDEISKRYFAERMHEEYIVRDDALIAKGKDDPRYEKYKELRGYTKNETFRRYHKD